MTEEFDPKEVEQIVAQALADNRLLPMTFIETTLFESLDSLLKKYLPEQDATWVISEMRSKLLSGFTQVTSPQMQTLIHNCIKCPNVERPPVQSKWNLSDPDLLIVLDNPKTFDTFGPELVSCLKSVGFNSSRCGLTYVSRCRADEPDTQQIKNCLPYLHTEVAVLNPKLILTLGKTAFGCLTGESGIKLNEVRGKVMWFGPYAVLPESSIGAMQYNKGKDDKNFDALSSCLHQCKSFLYGGS